MNLGCSESDQPRSLIGSFNVNNQFELKERKCEMFYTFMHPAVFVLQHRELVDVSELLEHGPEMFLVQVSGDLTDEQLDISVPEVTGRRGRGYTGSRGSFDIRALRHGSGMAVHLVRGRRRNQHVATRGRQQQKPFTTTSEFQLHQKSQKSIHNQNTLLKNTRKYIHTRFFFTLVV